jgi:glycosyltransferase involved in cell wall biosynthesis
VTNKKVLLLTIGLPDIDQGGSGIFNYLVVKYLIENGYKPKAVFLAPKKFIEKHINSSYLSKLCQLGLEYEIISDDTSITERFFTFRPSQIPFGLGFLKIIADYWPCKNFMDENIDNLREYDFAISQGLGWAMALQGQPIKSLSILPDDLRQKARFLIIRNINSREIISKDFAVNIFSYINLVFAYKKFYKIFFSKLNLIGSFSPYSVSQYIDLGIICKHYKWFTPSGKLNDIATSFGNINDNQIKIVSLGSLQSTAGLTFSDGMDLVLRSLTRLNRNISYEIIGKSPIEIQAAPIFKNKLVVRYLGFVDRLDEILSDAQFLVVPNNYPIGVRTRILTGLSYGLIVIAHKSSVFGLPELVSGKEIFYFNDEVEIAEILEFLFSDSIDISKYRANAFSAWKKYYNPENNISELVRTLTD